MDVMNPATEEKIDEITTTDLLGVEQAYDASRQALGEWAATPWAQRKKVISGFQKLLQKQKHRLAETLTSETGKPISQALGEIAATDSRIQFFLDRTEGRMVSRSVHQDAGSQTDEEISYEPLGVIANISAWNYPYFVGTNVFIPALLTGNTVLYKPSEYAAMTGAAIGRLMEEAGAPPGVFQVLQGGGDVGNALLAQAIDGVFFTGSHNTGMKIASQLAGRLVRLQMELGGKDPAYVAADVHVPKVAAALADAVFYNAGQSCCSVERIYVDRSIYDKFLDAFVAAVSAMAIGDPMHSDTYLGPLCRAPQLEILEEQVQDALAKGGKLLLGGARRPGKGYYFEPTVVAHATQDMMMMRDESFGPVIGIAPCDSEEEAVSMMADTPYGLTAAVFSQNRDVARRVLSRLKVGTAYWNCGDRVSPFLPWTGRGHSGMGSTLSDVGIDAFLVPKSWHWRQP